MTAFPPTWRVLPLSDVVDVLDSRRVPISAKERADRPGNIPYYGAAGQVGWIDSAIFDEPLVLLGEDGVQFFDPAKPKSYLIDGPAWVNNHAHVLRPVDSLDRRFLNYYLNVADYRGYANGTTRLKLTQSAMRRIPVPVPSLPEQRRIVDLLDDHLSRLDAAEAYLAQGLRKLGALKTKILASLHVGEMVPLGAMSVDSGYGTSAKCVPNGAGPAVVRIPNLVDGQVDLSDEKRVLDAGADVSACMLDPGDVLIIRTNGSRNLIGRSAVVQAGVDAAFASYLIRYRVRQDLVRPGWVHAMLSTPQIRGRIESLAASSAGQHNLSLGKLNPLELPVPSLVVQDAGLQHLAGIDAELSRLSAAVSDARQRATGLRSSLLVAAFSGRLTATAPDVSDAEEMIGA